MLFPLLVVFLDMMTASLVIPVLPPLILHLLGGNQAGSARVIGVLGTVFSAMQLLFGPLQGALSDRFGRRPVLIISCLGLAGAQVVPQVFISVQQSRALLLAVWQFGLLLNVACLGCRSYS